MYIFYSIFYLQSSILGQEGLQVITTLHCLHHSDSEWSSCYNIKCSPTSPDKTGYLNNTFFCLESLAQSWWLHCSATLAATSTQHTWSSMGLLCPDPHRNTALTCGQSFSPQPLPNCLAPVWLQFFISIARKLIHLQNRQQHKVRNKPAGFSMTVPQDMHDNQYGHHWLAKPDQPLTLASDALFTPADKNKLSRKGEHLLSKKGALRI